MEGIQSINWLDIFPVDDQNTELPSPRHLQYTVQPVLKLGNYEIAAIALLGSGHKTGFLDLDLLLRQLLQLFYWLNSGG